MLLFSSLDFFRAMVRLNFVFYIDFLQKNCILFIENRTSHAFSVFIWQMTLVILKCCLRRNVKISIFTVFGGTNFRG